MRAEPRCLLGLVAGDRDALERLLLRLLEDHPKAVERLARLPANPARGTDLPEAVDQGRRLAKGRELHARDARRLAGEVVDRHGAVAAAAAHADLFDDPPR